MRFLLFKVIGIAIILFVLCLPFFPEKYFFSLASQKYEKEKRWRNISFVIETVLISCVLLCIAPYIKDLLDWFFNLGLIAWLKDKFPDRFVYSVEVIFILVTNLLLCYGFLVVKNVMRPLLDKYVFKDSQTGNKGGKSKNAAGKTNTDTRDKSEKRLKQLRRESVLVFGKLSKKKNNVIAADYKKPVKASEGKKAGGDEQDGEESLTLREAIKKIWFKFIGFFYDEEQDFRYVNVGSYRWARILRNFLFFVCIVYLLVCVAMLIPMFFSVKAIPGFYKVMEWIAENTYMFPILSIIMLFEIFWFLDGEYMQPESADPVFLSFVDGIRVTKKADLEKARVDMLNKYASLYRIKNFEAVQMLGGKKYTMDEKSEAIQNLAKALRSGNRAVNLDYMSALEKMIDGKHVLVDSSVYSAVGEYVMHYLFLTLSFGKRILFICKDKKEAEKAKGYLENGFKRITRTHQLLWRICNFEQLHGGERPDVLILTPEEFMEKKLFVDGTDFFSELEDVFVLDVDKILSANNYYCLIMAKKLEKATTTCCCGKTPLAAEKRIRYTFFANNCVNTLEDSIVQFFDIADSGVEYFHSYGAESKASVFVWNTGNSSEVYIDNAANQVAIELQIAKDAKAYGVNGINLITDTEIYSNQTYEIPGLSVNSCDISDDPVGYVIVADDRYNLPNALYNYSRFSGKKDVVLHVVSKPYLLREFFVEKAEEHVKKLEITRETVCEHADRTRIAIISLLCDAVNGIELEHFTDRVKKVLEKDLPLTECDEECKLEPALDLQACVDKCYEIAFGKKVDSKPRYVFRREHDSEFNIRDYIYIEESEKLYERLLEHTRTVRLDYLNTQSSETIPVFADEICQHFIPGQVMVRNNKPYTIHDIDIENGVIVLDDTGPSVNVPMDYVQTRHYRITNATERIGEADERLYKAESAEVTRLKYTVYDADVEVDTVGYYHIDKSCQSIDLTKPAFSKYENIISNGKLFERLKRNINTGMLVLEFDIKQPSDAHVTYLFAVIMQEIMKTVFPNNYKCISVCPLFDDVDEEQFFEGNTAIRDIYPRITQWIEEKEDNYKTEGRVRIAIIEDIKNGNRAIDTLVEKGTLIMLENILGTVSDFLVWSLSPLGKNFSYLNFGYEKCPELFDFAKLDTILRQYHRDYVASEARYYNREEGKCFFCHRDVADGEGEVLSDGRLICNVCKETSVDTFEELDGIFKDVISSIKKSTSVYNTFPDNITVDFVSTEELKDRYPESDRIPVAYCNHVTGGIFVEYGLSKSAVAGVISRKITELWQDRNIVSGGEDAYFGQVDYVEIATLIDLKFGAEAEILDKLYRNNQGFEKLKALLSGAGTTDSFEFLLNYSGNANELNDEPVEEPTEEPVEEPVGEPTGEPVEEPVGEPTEEPVEEPVGEPTEEPSEKPGEEVTEEEITSTDPGMLAKFLYKRLNPTERKAYDQILKAIMAYERDSGTISLGITPDRCGEIFQMVVFDNPEIEWVTPYRWATNGNANAACVVFEYLCDRREAEKRKKKVEKAIKPFIKGIKKTMSEYEIALLAHENIIDRIDYDSLALDIEEREERVGSRPDDLRSLYGVFVNNKAVCAGYAKAYQYLLNRLGIECAYVRGECHGGGYHAWNIAKIDGDYYYIDTTHDDNSNTDKRKHMNAEVSYDFFCVTTADILKSRNIKNAHMYPQCVATKCNYHIRNGMYFTQYDARKIRSITEKLIASGKKEISFRASDASVYNLIKKRLVDDGGMYDILRSIPKCKYPHFTYYSNKELNILHIIVE